MNKNLYTLNYKKSLFSTYAKDKSFIITSFNKSNIENLQYILNQRYSSNKTWMKNIQSIHMYSENHIEIKIGDNIFCNLQDNKDKLLDITYFQLNNQTDLLFIYQLSNMMNTHVFVINEFEYNNDIPLLSLNGFFIEYHPQDIRLEIDYTEYLNAIFNIDE